MPGMNGNFTKPVEGLRISPGRFLKDLCQITHPVAGNRMGGGTPTIPPRIKICEKEGWFLSASLPYHGRPK